MPFEQLEGFAGPFAFRVPQELAEEISDAFGRLDVESVTSQQGALVRFTPDPAIPPLLSPDAPDIDIRQVFLGLVERLTVSHVKLLQLFKKPIDWFESRPEDYERLLPNQLPEVAIREAMPSLGENWKTAKVFFQTIQNEGLLNLIVFGDPYTRGDLMTECHLTDFGMAFLKFISKPDVSTTE